MTKNSRVKRMKIYLHKKNSCSIKQGRRESGLIVEVKSELSLENC